MRMPRQPATDARRELLADSLGVGIATGAYGVSFGAIAVTAGFDVLQTCALSLLVFTGASQFALVGV
ncbi:MAG: AzlC family ABC transporter permease, partial [Nocardioidaceae bacterium]|nr:AzlC family ABC transporter permease [Nocardioidaceae bacterium]